MTGQIAYEEFIPTDKWSLQDWYLLKMVKIENIFTRIMRGWFSGGVDRRALMEFRAEVFGYKAFAFENMKKHLSEVELAELSALLQTPVSEEFDMVKIQRLMDLLSLFHWKSGLSKLSESKPLGPFAYARSQRGLGGDGFEHNDD